MSLLTRFALAAAMLAPLGAQAQIVVGNSVFPSAGDSLYYALDRNPGPAIQVTPPGSGTWDFSSLKAQTTWVETLRPASTGTGAALFGDATLVYTQTGPASVNFPLLPGSNGSEAYLKVTDSAVSLLGFHGGSDAVHLGGAYVHCDPVSAACGPTTAFMTRFQKPQELMFSPKQFFDLRLSLSAVSETYPASTLVQLQLPPGINATALRVQAATQRVTAVDGFGTLVLPGGSFDVLREKTVTNVFLELDAIYALPFGWFDAKSNGFDGRSLLPGPRWGAWEQTTYRYFDANSKEALAITYSPIEEVGSVGSSLAIEQVQFRNLAAVPEPQTALLFLLGLAGLMQLKRRARATA